MAAPQAREGSAALAHILKVESDVALAAARLESGRVLRTAFPQGAFGNAVRSAVQVAAMPAGVAAIRITLNGFDTHRAQAGTHQRLLGELSAGLVALKAGLEEIGRWDETLVLSYAEFGRRPRENASGGTDHGTAAAHFALGGRVRGGLYGAAPALSRLEGGNLPFAVDFRCLYATVLRDWWGLPAEPVLNGRYESLGILRG